MIEPLKQAEISKMERISNLLAYEDLLLNSSGIEKSNGKSELGLGCRYEHSFTDGLYIRKMFIPKGLIISTKIHKTLHPYFIMYGDVSVYNGDFTSRITAPYCGVTSPGTKRILYTHEDTLWITVHVTDKKDVKEIGKDIVAESFDEITQTENNGGKLCHGEH